MIKIAICDDESFFAKQLKNNVQSCFNLSNIDVEIDIYNDGINLLKALKKDKLYDLILLDIQMKELDGIELGEIIRKENQWETIEIIYISSERHRAIEAIPIRVFDFIYKPIKIPKVEKVLKRFIDIKSYKNEYIEVVENNIKQKIFFDKIIYIGAEGRYNFVVTYDKYYKIAKTLTELENIFPKRNFARIHKGFIINLDKINRYNYEEVIMINGAKLSIPQNRRVEFRKMFINREK